MLPWGAGGGTDEPHECGATGTLKANGSQLAPIAALSLLTAPEFSFPSKHVTPSGSTAPAELAKSICFEAIFESKNKVRGTRPRQEEFGFGFHLWKGCYCRAAAADAAAH